MIGEIVELMSGCGMLGELCETGCDVALMGCESCEEIVSGGIMVISVSVCGMRSCVIGEVSGMGCSGSSTGVEMGSSCLGEEDSSSSGLLDGGSVEGVGSGGGVLVMRKAFGV